MIVIRNLNQGEEYGFHVLGIMWPGQVVYTLFHPYKNVMSNNKIHMHVPSLFTFLSVCGKDNNAESKKFNGSNITSQQKQSAVYFAICGAFIRNSLPHPGAKPLPQKTA